MTDPKPVRMWAVYDPDDDLLCVDWLELDAQMKAIQPYETWHTMESRGYRCIPVTITPDAPCTWTEDTKDPGVWRGTCGVCWTFEDGTPDENKVNFCPRCGARRVTLTPDPESEK